MNAKEDFQVSREKHLDHLVKVVPIIVVCYALQCFIILSISSNEFLNASLSFLGIILTLMICSFIVYDLNHEVILKENELKIKFFFSTSSIRYADIHSMTISDPEQSFSNLIIVSNHHKHTLYFIDDAVKIHSMIESRRYEFKAAA